jgi:hypothetical protein
MAYKAMLAVEMFGMGTVNAMKDSANRVEAFGDGDVMHVIGHETVSNDAQQKFATTVREQREVVETIGFITKDIEPSGSTLSNVMRHPRHDETCGSGHN